MRVSVTSFSLVERASGICHSSSSTRRFVYSAYFGDAFPRNSLYAAHAFCESHCTRNKRNILDLTYHVQYFDPIVLYRRDRYSKPEITSISDILLKHSEGHKVRSCSLRRKLRNIAKSKGERNVNKSLQRKYFSQMLRIFSSLVSNIRKYLASTCKMFKRRIRCIRPSQVTALNR